MGKKNSKDYCRILDKDDPIAFLRKKFSLPKGKINMDGNSLGALPKTTRKRLGEVIQREWGEGLIASWTDAGWFDLPTQLGNKIAPLIGATKGEVLVADTTSINIFKLLCAAVQLNNDRKILLSEKGNFPTDLYLMQGLAAFSEYQLVNKTVHPDSLLDALDEDVAVLLLTHVNFKTAKIHDMVAITQRAHEKGILVIWDLSHSTGSIEVQLNAAEVDFAVGCGYKFLNGGPGAPAFLYVAKKHQKKAQNILSGWMGHKDPFAFTENYISADGIARFRCGTPGILGMKALECGIELFDHVSIQELRKKTLKLSRLFIQLMEQECSDFGFKLISPNDDKHRAGHIAYKHKNGLGIYQALRKEGIIIDFRMPNILRFGITPMYLRYRDIYKTVKTVRKVMQTKAWDNPKYQIRGKIT